MDGITQDMKYRYSLMKYVETYGVSQASCKYNKGRSYKEGLSFFHPLML